MDTENNMNPMIILELNQKVKELIAMENIPLLRDFFLKYDMIMQQIALRLYSKKKDSMILHAFLYLRMDIQYMN